jgi:nucleotidyltransferase/DNA polymerase involved in DNA repair
MESRKAMNTKSELLQIPGVGKSICRDLEDIGIYTLRDLKNKDPEKLYEQSNQKAGTVQDRCLLYVFRCAVYYAEHKTHDPEKLKWWNWKDGKMTPTDSE